MIKLIALTYPGDTGPATSYPRDLHSSVDGQFIAMAGYFTGSLTFGDTTLKNTRSEVDGAFKDGFVAKIKASDGSAEWAFGSKKKKKSSSDSLALGLGLGLGLGGLLLIGLVAMLCMSKKKQSSTSTRGADVENEMVKTGAAMS